jgi:hypothetical protein
MSCISIDDEKIIRYKKCTKCDCKFKLHLAGRSERRSCKYHNFDNNYCVDCGCFRHQVQNMNCLHIYHETVCLSCVIG